MAQGLRWASKWPKRRWGSCFDCMLLHSLLILTRWIKDLLSSSPTPLSRLKVYTPLQCSHRRTRLLLLQATTCSRWSIKARPAPRSGWRSADWLIAAEPKSLTDQIAAKSQNIKIPKILSWSWFWFSESSPSPYVSCAGCGFFFPFTFSWIVDYVAHRVVK